MDKIILNLGQKSHNCVFLFSNNSKNFEHNYDSKPENSFRTNKSSKLFL